MSGMNENDAFYKDKESVSLKNLEKQIDQIIYKLSGLTDEEIKIVGG